MVVCGGIDSVVLFSIYWSFPFLKPTNLKGFSFIEYFPYLTAHLLIVNITVRTSDCVPFFLRVNIRRAESVNK